jgi:Flp pilus assembly protein TadG
MTTNMNNTSTRPVSARHRPWREAGSISVELAILAPIFAGLIVLGIVVGRSSIAYHSVAAAAHDAARAASISRSETTAIDQATTAAQATLDDQGLDCATVTIGVEADQLNRPVGEAGRRPRHGRLRTVVRRPGTAHDPHPGGRVRVTR